MFGHARCSYQIVLNSLLIIKRHSIQLYDVHCTCHTNLLYTCHTIHLQSSETYYYKVHVLRKLSMKNQGNGNYKEVLKYDIENSLKN